MKQLGSFFNENSQVIGWLVIAIFVGGSLYAEFQYLMRDLEAVERRLEKKIQVINEHEDRLDELEEYRAYEEGLRDAKQNK